MAEIDFEKLAAEKLPCTLVAPTCATNNGHSIYCPAYYRESIAALLREVDAKAYVRGLEDAVREILTEPNSVDMLENIVASLNMTIDAAKAGVTAPKPDTPRRT